MCPDCASNARPQVLTEDLDRMRALIFLTELDAYVAENPIDNPTGRSIFAP